MPRPLLAPRCSLLAAVLAASPALAQQGALDPQCAGAPTLVQDACQKSADIFGVVAPQLGPGIAGGNAIFGGEGALGRFGAVSVGIRANAVRSRLPRMESVRLSANGPVSTDFETTEPYVPIPTADVALGLFGGIPAAPGVRVGAIDALASVSYVPDYEDENVTVNATGQRLQFGYGARLGLLQESALLPGLAVTYLRRDLPEAELVGRVSVGAGGPANDTIGVSGLRTETHAWRAVASKRVALLGIALGAGQDRYASRARLRGVLNESTVIGPMRIVAEGFDFRQRLTRTNYFADLSLHLPLLTLVVEVGQVSGGTAPRTYNAFDGDHALAEEPVTYGAVGVRVKF